MTAARCLAAVLAVDVVGYSRLMGIGKPGITLADLPVELREVENPKGIRASARTQIIVPMFLPTAGRDENIFRRTLASSSRCGLAGLVMLR
jgi:hypothetical protein